jgi:hypothetical protein
MVPFDRFAVVLDACIMFPMLVRDVLLTLAANEFFSPKCGLVQTSLWLNTSDVVELI